MAEEERPCSGGDKCCTRGQACECVPWDRQWQVSGSLCTSNRQAREAISQVTDTSPASDGFVSGKGVSGKVAGRCLHVLAADSEASAMVPDTGQASDQK